MMSRHEGLGRSVSTYLRPTMVLPITGPVKPLKHSPSLHKRVKDFSVSEFFFFETIASYGKWKFDESAGPNTVRALPKIR